MKTLNILLIVAVCTACNGQMKTNNSDKPSPIIIKSFPARGVAPDFDTTHVSQYIRSIFQDSKGNLWFGTISDGVVRYDEKTLRYFSNPEGFYNQTVYAINEDKSGNMWFGTEQGVYKYDGKTFRNYNKKNGLNHLDISRKSILVDKSGTIWVGTHGGIYQYDPTADEKGLKCFSFAPNFPKINVAGIMEDKSGHIWVASSDNGVYRYDGKMIINYTEKELIGENYAGGIAQDNNGNMWFTSKNGICKYDGKAFTEYTTKDGLGGTEFWGIIIEKSGIIWVTARGATTRFDPSVPLPNPKAFKVFTPADNLNCCVQSMYQDNSGRMWWGTGQGLYRFDGNKFYQVNKNGPW